MSREKMASTGILGNLNLKTPGLNYCNLKHLVHMIWDQH